MNKVPIPTTTQLGSYYWQGINHKGLKLKGTMLAICEAQVAEQLNERDISVRLIRQKPLPGYSRIKHKVRTKDLTNITRQWATMLASGLPITTSLKLIMQNQKRAELRSVLWMISHQLQAGLSVSSALKHSSRYFDALYIDIVDMGEKTGNLAASLEHIAQYREKTEQLTSRVQRAAIYPSLVVLTALAVSLLMLTKVIPEFEALFIGYGAELPWFTQQVLSLSQAVQHHSLSIGTMSVLIPVAFVSIYRSSARFRYWLSRVTLHLPILGTLLLKSCMARFSRTLSTSLKSGLPILTSLETAARTTDNAYYQHIIRHLIQQTSAGIALHSTMRQSRDFPELMVQMIMIGEESGRLDDMLTRVANQYEADIDATVESLAKTLEPILILALGGLVGSLVIAMYLPIFNLMNIMG
ncbi:type II secretion system F family protein [Vibrio sp. Isolate24]|uniref:type II secretion system F family protein n=1 Tax=Vibrio sp. Isolate24 TaxID=2908534 RepID=UPI001EFC411C|nr:type II secretion system F family protein [Vibrio sp. Isolate24]MCG9678236.1 type II secretion system F family protein [Vibrio sp. Isolate24]